MIVFEGRLRQQHIVAKFIVATIALRVEGIDQIMLIIVLLVGSDRWGLDEFDKTVFGVFVDSSVISFFFNQRYLIKVPICIAYGKKLP